MASVLLDQVFKTYPGGFTAVKGVSFAVPDGGFCVLVGPSGCGKSTLLRMIAGLETISDGAISIGERIVNKVEPMDRDIAMVFQNYALYPHMSVFDNMAYGLRNLKTPEPEIRARVNEAAKILELDDEMLKRKPRQLSGGQRQRVAMGRAIVRKPSVFLFDEPLSNLDAKLRVQMRIEIRKLQRRLKTTSVYVTHDQLEAMTHARPARSHDARRHAGRHERRSCRTGRRAARTLRTSRQRFRRGIPGLAADEFSRRGR